MEDSKYPAQLKVSQHTWHGFILGSKVVVGFVAALLLGLAVVFFA